MAEAVAQVRFGLLGPVSVSLDGEPVAFPAARQRTLLAALLLKANQVAEVGELADQLWDGAPPAAAADTLRSYVLRLRRTLGPVAGARLRTRSPGYLFEIHDDDELDLRRFAALRRRAQDSAMRLDWSGAAADLLEALGLWRGAALEDIPVGSLRERELPSLQEGWIQTQERLARAYLELGRAGEVPEQIMRFQAEYPYREHLSTLLMRALVATGRTAEALAEYTRLRRTLIADLGVEPGSECRALHAAILAGGPVPAWPGEGPVGNGPALLSSTDSVDSDEIADIGPALGPAVQRPIPRQLPGTVRRFVGRSAQLRILTKLAESADDTGTVIAAIAGMAGTGKTTLAVHWAQQTADQFPDGQLYVNLRGFDSANTPVTSAEAILGFLDALGVDSAHLPVGTQAQVALYRSLLAGRRVLIVLDNARDDEHVRPLLPGGSTCLVVVTSRTELIGLATTEGAHTLALGLLTADESRELLAGQLGDGRLAAEPVAVEELISQCAGLALATGIVAARAAADPTRSLAALARELRDARGRLDVLGTGDAATDLRTVFSWSNRQLSERAAGLFRLLGLYPAPDISSAAAASLVGLPLREARAAMAELVRAHLVTELAPGRFAPHDLLRVYAGELAEAQERAPAREAAIRRVLDHYLHTAYQGALLLPRAGSEIEPGELGPDVTLEELATPEEALEWCSTTRRTLIAVIAWAAEAGFDIHCWQLASSITAFLNQRARWQNMVDIHLMALAAARRLGDRFAEALARRTLGYAHGRLGNYDRACVDLFAATDIFQAEGFIRGCARSHQGLSWVLSMRGEHTEAMTHAQRALKLMQDSSDRNDYADALNLVGRCHVYLGAYDQGISDCRQSLAIFQQADNAMGQAESWFSLGLAHYEADDHLVALSAFQAALDLFHKLGDRHYIGETLAGLAGAHEALGDREVAADLRRRALIILADIQHPDAEMVREKLLLDESHRSRTSSTLRREL